MLFRSLIVFLVFTSALAASPFPVVNRYSLDVSFDPTKGFMAGNAGVYFDTKQPVESNVVFYLHGELRIDSVLQAGKSVTVDESQVFYSSDYSLIADRVAVSLDPQLPGDSLRVFYSGYFSPSKARSPSDYMRIDSTVVALRALGYSLWFPVFLADSMASYRVTFDPVKLSIPADFQIIFNGVYLVDTVEAGQRKSPWRAENIEIFDAQCSAARWKIAHRGGLYAFHDGDDLSNRQAFKILDFAQRLLDTYHARYNSSAGADGHFILELPPYGDISSGNVTGLSAQTWKSFDAEVNARVALAHELVHPFVRANVPKSDSLYALATEGFPSYFHLHALAYIFGRDWYNNLMEWVEQEYLNKKRSGADKRGQILPVERPLLGLSADDIGVYKDRFVLDDRALLWFNWLRSSMGEKSFGLFCKQLFAGTTTTTGSFERLCLKYLPFRKDDIHQWLYTTDFPDRFRLVPSKGK